MIPPRPEPPRSLLVRVGMAMNWKESNGIRSEIVFSAVHPLTELDSTSYITTLPPAGNFATRIPSQNCLRAIAGLLQSRTRAEVSLWRIATRLLCSQRSP